jgi:hypothetical protein
MRSVLQRLLESQIPPPTSNKKTECVDHFLAPIGDDLTRELVAIFFRLFGM